MRWCDKWANKRSKKCHRLDLHAKNLEGGYPNRASRLCRTTESLVPGAKSTVPTDCAWSSFYEMAKTVSTLSFSRSCVYMMGTNADWRRENTASFVRTLMMKVRIQKTTMCLNLKLISPSVDRATRSCRSEKKCQMISIEVANGNGNGSRRRLGPRSDMCAKYKGLNRYGQKCEGEWVEQNGYNVKKMH